MNKYHIRIDGEESTNSYTYQELVDMGLFELDTESLNGIEIKITTKSSFIPIKSYCFPERQSNENSYCVDEFGQIHRRSQDTNKNGSYIDEFGQIVRPNNSTPSSLSSTSTSGSSSSSSNNSPANDGETNSGKIIGTIAVLIIGFVIAIAIADAGGGKWLTAIPIFVGYLILKAIWDWDD